MLLFLSITATSNSAVGRVQDRTNGTVGQVAVHTGEIKNNKNDFVEWKDLSDVDEIVNINNKNSEQDTSISENKSNISSNARRISDVDNRVNGLEKSQHKVTLGVRVIDTRKWIGEVSATKTVNNNNKAVDFEAKLIYKMGKSYTEKRLDELELRLNALNNPIEVVVDGTTTKLKEK